MRLLLFPVMLVSLLTPSLEAQAHAFLLKSNPTVGAVVAAPPKTVRLEFSEGIELAFSGVDVTSGANAAVATEKARFDGNGRKVLVVDLPPLAPGAYRVKWHVVSVDTHRTEGEFRFTVKP
jgi:methionine-rich copper-binding protein CopC